MLISALLFAGSMIGIILVARFALYEPAQRLARAAKFSRAATGQMLGYLTSSPELVATVFVAGTGLFAVVSYNILGSNIVNVFLAGIAALWFKQVRTFAGRGYRFEQSLILLSIIIPIILLLTGQDSAIWSGIALITAYIGYLLVMRKRHQAGGPVEDEDAAQPWHDGRPRVVLQIALLVAGLVALYFLGDVLGDSIYELGTAFGVSSVILGGLTAVATSLPELTTFFASYAAHRRSQTDGNAEVMHNLMASNVFNLLIIQAIGIAIFQIFA